ncbi:MAG: hypothetical protein R2681_03350 [Pyrinomonadaceae bacterium]
MRNSRKIDFSGTAWESAGVGIREKRFSIDGKTIRLVELDKKLKHPEWCETGHWGYVVSGKLEIVFSRSSEIYSEGDGIFIRPGTSQKHIPKPLTEKVTLFLIDEN